MMFTTSKKACVAAALTSVAGLQISTDCAGLSCGVPARDPDDPDAEAPAGGVVAYNNIVAESFHGGLLYLSALTGVAAGHLGRALMLTNDAPAVQAGPVEDELDAASDVDGDGVLSEDEADLANQIIAAHEQQQAAEVSAILGNGGDDDVAVAAADEDAVAVVQAAVQEALNAEGGVVVAVTDTATTEGDTTTHTLTEEIVPAAGAGSLVDGQRGPVAENTPATGAPTTPTTGTVVATLENAQPDDLVAVQVPSTASVDGATDEGASDDTATGSANTDGSTKSKPRKFRPKKMWAKITSGGRGSSKNLGAEQSGDSAGESSQTVDDSAAAATTTGGN